MEKFGIFELLDTLSAIVGDAAEPPSDGETHAPSVTDAAFLPPDYTDGGNTRAVTSFLDRHDKAVKRIGKKE